MGQLADSVEAAVKKADLPETDLAAARLAWQYATLMDEASEADRETATKVFNDLGPKLLAALTAVGLTAAGRAVKPTGGDTNGNAGSDPLSALIEEAEAARRNGAASVDAAPAGA